MEHLKPSGAESQESGSDMEEVRRMLSHLCDCVLSMELQLRNKVGGAETSNKSFGNSKSYQQNFECKAEIPKFEGRSCLDDFLDWLYTVERIFEYKEIPEDRKVKAVAVKLVRKAANWYKGMKADRVHMRKSKVSTWEKLKKLMTRKYITENQDQVCNSSIDAYIDTGHVYGEKNIQLNSSWSQIHDDSNSKTTLMDHHPRDHIAAYVKANPPKNNKSNSGRSKSDYASHGTLVDAMHEANYSSRACHSSRPNCEATTTTADGHYQRSFDTPLQLDTPQVVRELLMENQVQANSLDEKHEGEQETIAAKKKGKGRSYGKTDSVTDYIHVPEFVFDLSEKPVYSFEGHLEAVLNLSWSRDQQLLSSSMDKTGRSWNMESKSCLKMTKDKCADKLEKAASLSYPGHSIVTVVQALDRSIALGDVLGICRFMFEHPCEGLFLKVGLGSCLLAELSGCVEKCSARLVRFMNNGGVKLPDEILNYNLEETRRCFLSICLEVELDYLTSRMMVDNAMVQKLSVCETMGSATTICTDKIGTLTMNQMKLTKFWLGKESVEEEVYTSISPCVLNMIHEGVSLNTSDSVFRPNMDAETEISVSPTEKAILSWVVHGSKMDMEKVLKSCSIVHVGAFNSKQKQSGVLVKMKADGSIHVRWKGAAEMILAMCTSYYNTSGLVTEMDEKGKRKFEQNIQGMATSSLRCIAFAQKQVPAEERVNTDRNVVLKEDRLTLFNTAHYKLYRFLLFNIVPMKTQEFRTVEITTPDAAAVAVKLDSRASPSLSRVVGVAELLELASVHQALAAYFGQPKESVVGAAELLELASVHQASAAYFGQPKESVVVDFNYCRTEDVSTPRFDQDVRKELEQLAFFKHGVKFHWAKNRNIEVLNMHNRVSFWFMKSKFLVESLKLMQRRMKKARLKRTNKSFKFKLSCCLGAGFDSERFRVGGQTQVDLDVTQPDSRASPFSPRETDAGQHEVAAESPHVEAVVTGGSWELKKQVPISNIHVIEAFAPNLSGGISTDQVGDKSNSLKQFVSKTKSKKDLCLGRITSLESNYLCCLNSSLIWFPSLSLV